MGNEITQNEKKSKIPKGLVTKHKNSINAQIQMKIGRSIAVIFFMIAVITILVVNNMVTSANNKELTLESQAASYQLAEIFTEYNVITNQMAANPYIQKWMTETVSLDELYKEVYGTDSSTENTDTVLEDTNTATEDTGTVLEDTNIATEDTGTVLEDTNIPEETNVSASSSSVSYEMLLTTLKGIQALNSDGILASWVSDLDVSVALMSDGYITEKGWDVTTRPWYECVTTGKTFMTEPYTDASTGKLVLTIATPVYNQANNVIGVSGLDISMENMTKLMSGYKIGDDGYVTLLTDNGTYIYHPNEELIQTYIKDANISEHVVEAVEKKTESFLEYKVNNESRFGYIASVGDTGYIVISSIPFIQYYSTLLTIILILVVVFAIGSIIILINMKKTANKITKPIEELNATAMQLAEGNLQVNIKIESDDEVGELASSIGKTVERLKEYINYIDEISDVLSQIAEGKLKISLKYAYVGEFQKVKEALYHISESMIDVMQNISSSSDQVSAGSDDLAKAAQGLAEGAEMQSVAIEELLKETINVAQQVSENKSDSEKSAENVKHVAQMMEESQNLMNEMRTAMDKIHETSQQVVGIIKAIEDIASQTNLLSLNASIEAARAGEAGKGFAVVAGEIGNLANESARAVNTTRELIGISLTEIEKGNELATDVLSSLSTAVNEMVSVNAMIQHSAEKAAEQMRSMNQIKNGVEEMSQGVQDNSAMAEETSATSEELAAQAIVLNDLVKKFELN